MSGWKYVMFDGMSGSKIPVIFPDSLVHRDVAETIPLLNPQVNHVVQNAGFVDGLICVDTSGESETLKIKSSRLDAGIINTHPYTKGILTSIALMTEKMVLEKTIELLQLRLKRLRDAG
jgi:hypothetical protein